ncbi:MAG: Asp23/Gls24 family envelope stress response protein [Clostridia bacterium]|nr:Asp23/Gls24 family envelope stress response protein [Clostridia bacterium]
METVVHVENGQYLGQTRFAKDLLSESLALSVKEVRGVAGVEKIKIHRSKDSDHLNVDVNLIVSTGDAVADVAYRVQEAVLNTATQFTKSKIDKVNIYVRGAKYGASSKQK